jgi:hypothetical protein
VALSAQNGPTNNKVITRASIRQHFIAIIKGDFTMNKPQENIRAFHINVPEMRTAAAEEYVAYQLGQINRKLDKIIAALGSTT